MTDAEELAFKLNVEAAFIGAWLANNYNDACARGEHERLSNPPVEDAAHMAGEALRCRKELVK